MCIRDRGWDEVAKVCLTHSYPVQDITADIGKNDLTKEEYDFTDKYIKTVTYDDYDKLIILCDALATAEGFCLLEKRFVDTTRRYGIFPFTVDRWNATFKIKEDFEKQTGCSIYNLLPNIKAVSYTHLDVYKRQLLHCSYSIVRCNIYKGHHGQKLRFPCL